ncbi:MAG: SIMPL domain-containing protein [Dehalococcoidales bacterium]|nr:SIMPL domain-containing protein [Dehalococcoidales bacterium]
MKRNLLLVIGMVVISLALVLSLVGFSACTAGPTEFGTIDISSQQEGLWVSGEGKVTVTPDLATLYLGIEAQADTVAEAQSQAVGAMDAVMAALAASGIAEKDIQTQYFSIEQVTSWDKDTGEEIVTGYRVTNMVTAKIRDIDNVGSTIDAVAAAGGDLVRISSIAFSVDDPSAYYEEAREEAMADAKAKAEQLAYLAGIELGKPTYISEWSSSPVSSREIYYDAAVPAPMPTPISPGELDITLTVQVAYAIED